MARTPRTFAGRSHTEAKAGQNIGQSKPCEDVTEKTKQTNQQEDISELSLTRSPRRFVGVVWLLRWCSARFRGWWLSDRRTWRNGVLSLERRRCNETNKYHPAQQSPHENDWLSGNENPHTRTSADEEPLTIAVHAYTCTSRPSQLALPLSFLSRASHQPTLFTDDIAKPSISEPMSPRPLAWKSIKLHPSQRWELGLGCENAIHQEPQNAFIFPSPHQKWVCRYCL